MLLKFIDSDEECVSFFYNETKNVFEIKNKEDKTICEYYPKLNLNAEFEPSNFRYYLLKNDREDYSENSIYQVCVFQKRIGWIFPIQALLSDQHAYCENPFFLKYAYVACCLLLNDIKSENTIFLPEIELTDFYDESLTLLVLDNDNIKEIKDFDIKDYTVSLYQKGYSYSASGNLDSEIEVVDKRLNLKSVSEELRKIQYIHTLFAKEIPKEQEAFAKFHIYYQIIEILITIVFEVKFKEFVERLKENSGSLFDKRDELGDMIIEKHRVKWLFSNYVSLSGETVTILNEQCKKFLKLNKKETSNIMAENLYSVRCLLVHSMYILNDESNELLEELNKTFLDIVMEMLLTFNSKR